MVLKNEDTALLEKEISMIVDKLGTTVEREEIS